MKIKTCGSLPNAFLFCILGAAAFSVQGQSSKEVALAIVDGKAITQSQLKPYLPPEFDSYEPEQASAVQRAALDNAIIGVLLAAEARRRKVPIHQLRKQMTAGPIRVLNSSVEEEFRKNARYFRMLSPDEAKERLRLHLGVDEQMKYYRAALAKLKAKAKIEIRLVPLKPANVSLTGTGPSDGRQSASITITMFSDFRCRYCRDSQPILAQVLEEYPDDVRLVFRHFPLDGVSTGMTPASSAVCADQQGRFWEFHDAAYSSSTLPPAKLRLIAAEVGLDLGRFEECVTSKATRETVAGDLAEARRLGISGTPAFIVNGKLYKGKLEFSQFKELIESELKSSTRRQGH